MKSKPQIDIESVRALTERATIRGFGGAALEEANAAIEKHDSEQAKLSNLRCVIISGCELDRLDTSAVAVAATNKVD